MGQLYLQYLGGNRIYMCRTCETHIADHNELISKAFQGKHGRAFLFNNVANVICGQGEQRILLTGLHTVADIYCSSCQTVIGWKYEHAFEESQQYKVGKFIIERALVFKSGDWVDN
eukprot:c18981_g2_i2.p1 GENE.c18981_g2_i2~~c18981_g2_i2.p1  ORF type:complete len:116 (+),score=25.90 c18981_g2_i2:52-399(+)